MIIARALIIVSVICGQHAVAGVVFNIENYSQKKIMGGLYSNCREFNYDLPAEKISTSSLPFINKLKLENRISFDFVCQTDRAIHLDISTDGNLVSVSPGKTSKIQTVSTSFQADSPVTHHFNLQVARSVVFKPGCHINLVSNHTRLPVDMLRQYSRVLMAEFRMIGHVRTLVRSASSAQSRNNGVQMLVEPFQDAFGLESPPLLSQMSERLRSLIDFFDADLESLLTDEISYIDHIRREASDVYRAFAANQGQNMDRLNQVVEESYQNSVRSLNELRTFLGNERRRMQRADEAYSRLIQSIESDLN